MDEARIAVYAVIVGLLGMSYGTFDYFQEARAMSPAPVHTSFESTDMFSVPICLGGGAFVAGVLLLIVFRAKGERTSASSNNPS